jgi:hypothetical protein
MLKHNFHIENLGKPDGWFKAHRYRYTCVRCGWKFLVENWRAKICALDGQLDSLSDPEGIRRVATFVDGPCEAADDRCKRRMPNKPQPVPLKAVQRPDGAARAIAPK